MNLVLEAYRVSCEGKVGCLHQKLLFVICGLIFTYTYHLNISDVDFLYEIGFCRTILLSEHMPYFCFLLGTSSSKIILNKKLNLYLSHTFDNILLTLHTILSSCWFDHFCYEECTLRETWHSVTWSDIPQSECSRLRTPYCGEECTLMQTLYWHSIQDFFCIQTSYFQFHCSLLTIPFCLAEFPNICISCWLFGSGVGWRATLIGEKFVTPKAQRMEQQKRLKQKHTSILLI